MRHLLVLALAASAAGVAAQSATTRPPSFSVVEATIPDMQRAMSERRVVRLTGGCTALLVGSRPGDWSRARALLGWEPRTSLEDGLERTITAYRKTRES